MPLNVSHVKMFITRQVKQKLKDATGTIFQYTEVTIAMLFLSTAKKTIAQ